MAEQATTALEAALRALLRALERHRLVFLYWAVPVRYNPLVTSVLGEHFEELPYFDPTGPAGANAVGADEIDGGQGWVCRQRHWLDIHVERVREKSGERYCQTLVDGGGGMQHLPAVPVGRNAPRTGLKLPQLGASTGAGTA
ncbi:MAG: hypothetical protein AMK72_08990 [Planctomycetes bacterium SM23_25]|nr:MAG: hypothetical protein AMK72_08990 [Planctomycetes bacterium SM23_25]